MSQEDSSQELLWVFQPTYYILEPLSHFQTRDMYNINLSILQNSNLGFKSGIFDSQLLLFGREAGISASGCSATVGATRFVYLLPHCLVFISEFLHFSFQQRVLMALLYGLWKRTNHPIFRYKLFKRTRSNTVNRNDQKMKLSTLIWVRRFWNQNLTCLGARPNCLLSCCLCFSSGWGDSLNSLQKFHHVRGLTI